MRMRQAAERDRLNTQRVVLVGHERVARQLGCVAHLAADAGVAGGVAGGVAALLEKGLYGTLCGAKNSGPFWPQPESVPSEKPNKLDKSMTVMILGK